MRVLLLLRGAPGAGKSTWIRENNLEQYALCADDIRMLFASPELNAKGKYQISQKNDKQVWDSMFYILESRMERGEFTIIDATNSKTSEMNRYAELCEKYRYRMYCVDFTDIPIEECKRRNELRPPYKQVPDNALEKIYSRFATQKIPAKITVLKPDELDRIWYRKTEINGYKKIHVIGDIHGCYAALMDYLGGELKDDEYYIFVGDYIDRGIENAETVQFLLSIYNKKNVYLLEGNHEKRLWDWANGEVTDNIEFETQTAHQLKLAKIDKKEVRKMYRKFGQCAYFDYGNKTYFICHGGISRIPDNLTELATSQLIRGTGGYAESYISDETFSNHSAGILDEDVIMIHGHRNVPKDDTAVFYNVFNLEGGVEHGGCLRCVTATEDGEIEVFETPNAVFRVQNKEEQKVNTDLGEMIINMRKNPLIKETSFGNISSFNFTKRAFYEKAWDDQTMKARGLFINIPEIKVVARAYDKFFNINERPETKLDVLTNTLSFPVTAYVKENGFLGIVSYDADQNDLFITTKSSPDGSMAEILRDIFYRKTSKETRDAMMEYAKTNDVSFVFECIDPERDPHIIEYREEKLVLLDIIENAIDTPRKLSYDELKSQAETFGLPCKKLGYVIENAKDFFAWYQSVLDEDYTYEGDQIEGFVIEDQRGFMVKLKLTYYNFWKFMRNVSQVILKNGHIDGSFTSKFITPLANHFYAWLLTQYNPETRLDRPEPIISLRRRFFESEHGKQFSENKGEATE